MQISLYVEAAQLWGAQASAVIARSSFFFLADEFFNF